MTGIPTLDVLIALAFIFLIYSLMSSIVAEIIADLLRLRARNLEMYLRFMLTDDNKMRWSDIFGQRSKYKRDLFHSFLALPSVKNLSRKRLFQKSGASYMKAETFVEGVIDTLVRKTDGKTEVERIETGIKQFVDHDQDTAQHLERMLQKSQKDVQKFKEELEKWFDNSMERCASSYKQLVQWKLLIIGFFVAMLFNVDIILISKKLADNEELAKKFATLATQVIEDNDNLDSLKKDFSKYNENIQTSLGLQKVYDASDKEMETNESLKHSRFLGYLIAALGISLGAPFWFDLLGKLVKLRSAVQPASPASGKGTTEKEQNKRVG